MTTNVIKVVIDKREIKLLNEFGDTNDIHPEVLDIGDIIFKVNDIPAIIIERKTLEDLSASIMDGRYKEQKKRLLQTNISKKYYIIEGTREKYNEMRMPYSTLESAMLSILFYNDIPIIRSVDVNNTKNIIKLLIDKLKKQKKDPRDDKIPDIKIIKKAKLNISDCCLAQLCQIPSISTIIGKCIVDKYHTLNNFYKAINQVENKQDYIKNIEYLSSKNKKMRIGEKRAEKIIEYIFT